MVVEESMQKFHFFDGKSLGTWYPKGLTVKCMVSPPLRCEHPAKRAGGMPDTLSGFSSAS